MLEEDAADPRRAADADGQPRRRNRRHRPHRRRLRGRARTCHRRRAAALATRDDAGGRVLPCVSRGPCRLEPNRLAADHLRSLRPTVGEDVELVVRLHRYLRERDEAYRVEFVPDSVCWTEAPEDLAQLGRQRRRQRGVSALALEEFSFRRHRRGREAARLWRLRGFVDVARRKSESGEIKRRGLGYSPGAAGSPSFE
jgi:hypothetical protein